MKLGLLTSSPFSAGHGRLLAPSAVIESPSPSRPAEAAPRAVASVARKGARSRISLRRSAGRAVVFAEQSRLAAGMARCAAAGIRFIITTPSCFPAGPRVAELLAGRTIDSRAHDRWLAGYRDFMGRDREADDRCTWRIVAVDREDRVVGAIAGRFFSEKVERDPLHVLGLLATTGPVFREHCELAISEIVDATLRAGRTAGEISHWGVAPIWRAALVAITLARAMGALASAFGSPVIVMAADNRRGEVNRLMRWGATALGIAGRSCLPPFVHHESGAWLRLLVLEGHVFQARAGGVAATDLNLLGAIAHVISAK